MAIAKDLTGCGRALCSDDPPSLALPAQGRALGTPERLRAMAGFLEKGQTDDAI